MLYNQLDEQGTIVKSAFKITNLTPSLPPGHTWVPYEESNDAIKLKLVEKIKVHRDTLTTQGGYKVDTKWYHSDVFSRIQQVSLTIMGNGVPPGLQWKTMDKTFVNMTPAIVQQLFQAAATQDIALFSYAEYLIGQVNASSDPASINIYAGWPETFVS